jgi:hypothetical protein
MPASGRGDPYHCCKFCSHLVAIDVTVQGRAVIKMIPGMTLEKPRTLTEPTPQQASNRQALAPPESPKVRAAVA